MSVPPVSSMDFGAPGFVAVRSADTGPPGPSGVNELLFTSVPLFGLLSRVPVGGRGAGGNPDGGGTGAGLAGEGGTAFSFPVGGAGGGGNTVAGGGGGRVEFEGGPATPADVGPGTADGGVPGFAGGLGMADGGVAEFGGGGIEEEGGPASVVVPLLPRGIPLPAGGPFPIGGPLLAIGGGGTISVSLGSLGSFGAGGPTNR
jgi:hypothetical protein